MEFIKLREDRYMIKNSNNIVVSEKEKLELEKKNLIIEDIQSNECQGRTTQRIKKIDRKLKNERKSITTETIEKTTEPTE